MMHSLVVVSSPNLLPCPRQKETFPETRLATSDEEGLSNDLFYNFSSPSQLKQVHALLIKTSTPLSVLPLSQVASVCALTSNFPYAHKILSSLTTHEITVWNSCIRNFAESASPFHAVLLFCLLREYDILPDVFTCSFVLKACVKLLDLNHGKVLQSYVEKLGYHSNLFLQNMIVHMYASCGAIADAKLLFDQMQHRDVVTWNILITHLIKRGDIDGANKLFKQMPWRSVRSWTAMIAGFVQCGKPKGAIGLFIEMEKVGLPANEVTVVAVLAACADVGALDLGRRIHEYSNKSGYETNIQVCNTLIDMYIKCGSLEDARKVFDKISERTIVSWSAMIQGLAMHGQAMEALELFSDMLQTGLRPNGVTFIGLLHACSHMGLVEKGSEFFQNMSRDYGITPQIEHYGCMVDLLSRAGLLQEAYQFIKEMPIKPNGVVWGALLGGCRIHKNIELAEEAIVHLNELEPQNDGYYVVLSNIYADAKQWENVARVRKSMRDQGVKKMSGCSIITVKGVLHEFVAGDESHPQAEDIFAAWENLLGQLRLSGYVPNTSVVLLDVDDAEKEKFLHRHSEKLALVFGLINTPPGETVRIMKNLRICEDCHDVMMLTSQIASREIVVRDRNRFHCFQNGSCSCKGYW